MADCDEAHAVKEGDFLRHPGGSERWLAQHGGARGGTSGSRSRLSRHSGAEHDGRPSAWRVGETWRHGEENGVWLL
jgi:hypothetical protein